MDGLAATRELLLVPGATGYPVGIGRAWAEGLLVAIPPLGDGRAYFVFSIGNDGARLLDAGREQDASLVLDASGCRIAA